MGSCLSSDGSEGPPLSPLASSPPGAGKKLKRGSSGRGAEQDKHQVLLRDIPGRMFANGASDAACLFTQQGKKGTNQDAMIVWENFGSRKDTIFCGVFDGHGPFGHVVARKVRDSLPLKLSAHMKVNIDGLDIARENGVNTTGNLASEDTIPALLDDELRDSVDLEGNERYPEMFTTLKQSFLKTFKVMDKELKLHPNIDCFCSGTTAVTLVKQGQDLVIGNVGDSRAVLATRDNGSLLAVQLTVDLKPNLPREEERIKKHRGRVFSLRDEPDVARVWLPHNDSPGLAMARAFGDFCLKDFGLISVPEIFYRRLTERDEFIVLATDGVWDVLSNKEVVDIVASAPSRSSAAHFLVESAVRAWRYKYPTSKIDDCAVVCLFLSCKSENAASASIKNIFTSKEDPGRVSLSAMETTGSNDTNPLANEGIEKGKGKGGKQANASGVASHHRAPSDGISAFEGDEWSALEGVSRVNTLITLPRFTVPRETKSKKSV